MRARIFTAGTAMLCLVAMGMSISASCSKSSSSLAASDSSMGFAAMNDEPSTAREFRGALLGAGLDPASLTAAGVTAQEIPSVLSDAREYLDEHMGTLRSAESSATAQAQIITRITRAVQAGTASQEDVTALAAAKSDYATASAQRESIFAALRTAALEGVNEAKRTGVATLTAARDSELPIQYRMADRSTAESVALRDALANVRIANKLGTEPDSESAVIVNTANAHPAVAAATARMSGVDAVAVAWKAACRE
jgi:hypothetical protein